MVNSHKYNAQSYINLYFQVHQPRRLGQFSFFDIGTGRDYFDDGLNQLTMHRIARESYLPANLLLLKLIHKYPQLRITFSISGTALKQLEAFAPAVMESFQMLAATGSVEFLSETYYHSLGSLISRREFEDQIKMHAKKMDSLSGINTSVFRNTELIYSDNIGEQISDLGYKGIVTEGIDGIQADKINTGIYKHLSTPLIIFMRNKILSDDLAFRCAEHPRMLPDFLQELERHAKRQQLTLIGLDYETFGEHHTAGNGIFGLLEALVSSICRNAQLKTVTLAEAISLLEPEQSISLEKAISWADKEKDLSAWLGNDMQQDAFRTLSKMEKLVRISGSESLISAWRYLQTSDHFYYMSTKSDEDGTIHNYFSPYPSPYEAFMNYMNILADLQTRLHIHGITKVLPVAENQAEKLRVSTMVHP